MTTALPRLAPLLLFLAAPALANAAPLALPAPPAAPPPAAAQATPTAPAPDPDVVYYPAAARAAGVEGKAVIHCSRSNHLKLTGCTLVSETPAGQGFGAAALAMAAANQDNPRIDTTEAALVQPADITVSFGLHPPGIDPDLSAAAHVVTSPTIVTFPTHDQVKSAYPVRALSDNVEGLAALDCLVTKDGALESCRIFGERPTGYGFGLAAIDLAPDYKLKPRLVDGVPVNGAPVRIPVPFTLQDPTAPLELQTTPDRAPTQP